VTSAHSYRNITTTINVTTSAVIKKAMAPKVSNSPIVYITATIAPKTISDWVVSFNVLFLYCPLRICLNDA